MRLSLPILILVIASTFMFGCSSTQPKVGSNEAGPPVDANRGNLPYTETGKASFYDNKHQMMKTASGELYDHSLSTAAHKTLPLGVKVKVTNIENGKSVVVKINDRGPFAKGRIIDLSQSAFSSIADTSSGLIDVKIEIVE